MLPPSATLAADALRVSVLPSALSVTVVLGVPVVVSDSKLPPLVPVMLAVTVSVPCTCESSGRTAIGAELALLAPTGIVMVAPLESVTTSGLPATGALVVAV